MSINGLPSTSASATPQRVDIFSPGQRYAFINDGASSIFLRTTTNPVAAFVGTETELRATAMRAAEVKPGECLNKTVTTSTVEVVCGTGKTSTLRIFSCELGMNLEVDVSIGASELTDIAKGTDYVLSVEYLMAVSTAGTLVSYAAALPATCTRIAVIPNDDATESVRFAIGKAATAATSEIPPGGIVLPVTKTIGDTIQFYAASATNVSLLVFIPRS